MSKAEERFMDFAMTWYGFVTVVFVAPWGIVSMLVVGAGMLRDWLKLI